MMLYFDWFDLPVSLFPDASLLKQRFLSKSKLFHPDKFTLASDDEQASALESSGFNNQAYKILSDVDARIHYILGEYGLLKDDKEAMPPDFLMKMMVFNEAISDLEDDSSTFSVLKNDLAEWERELAVELDHCAIIPLDIESAGHLKTYFFKRKYYLRIQDNLSKFAHPFV